MAVTGGGTGAGAGPARAVLVNLAGAAARVVLPTVLRGGTIAQRWAEPSRLVSGAASLRFRAGHARTSVMLEPYSLAVLRGR
jgi:hypothetical protein